MPAEHNGKKMYTLNDIARELGVNKATVSKAISGKGNLSAETRARILKFIEQCGYRPNAVAQSLARSKTYNLGLMIPDDAGVFDMAFFRDCLQGVCKTASENGYDVLITMSGDKPVEQISRLIDYRKIDGVIALRSLVNSPIVGFLKEKKVPFVLIGTTSDPDVPYVDNDNRGACRELTTLLISRGIRRMALLGGDENNCVTHSRLMGFADACEQAGLKQEQQRIYLNVNRDNRLLEAMDAVMAERVDCIVCMDDYICNMVLGLLRSSQMRIPEDVKVVSFYDNVLLERNIPSVTSLRFDAAALGQIACQKLISILENRPGGSMVSPGYQMILRDSTK